MPFKHYAASVIGESVEEALSQGQSAYRQEQTDGGVPRQTVARWVEQFAAQAPGHLLHSLPGLGMPASCPAEAERAADRPAVAEPAPKSADGGPASAGGCGFEQERAVAVTPVSGSAESAVGQASSGAAEAPARSGGLGERAWQAFLAWGKREGRLRSGRSGSTHLLDVLQPALSGLRPAVGVFRIPLNRACRGPPA